MKVAWNVLKNVLKRITSSSIFWYVFFGFAAYWAYKRFTKPPNETFIDTPLPNNGSGIPLGWKPDELANSFHDYFIAWIANSSTLQLLYIQANTLTNDQFVEVVKTYNAKYAKLDGDITLWTRVKGWKAIWFGTGTNDQNTFIQRMISLKQDY